MNSKIRRLGLDASYAAAGSEDVVDNALCPICHDYIEDARETDCDARHVFCGPCIKDVSDRKQPCPCCRGAFSKMERPQALTRAFIEQVKWKCVHFERGCSFTGTKKQLEKHLDDECTIQEVKFPFSGCPTKMQRGPLDDHKKACPYRMAPCDHCKEQVRFNFKAAHKMVCPKFPIPCPQMCGRNLARDEVASHLQKECAEMVVACSVPGCGERMKRKLTDKHEDDNMKKHVKLLHIQLEKMKTLHSQVNFSPQRDRVQLNSGTLEMTVRFPDYETKAAGMAKDQYFESIPFLFEGRYFALRVYPKGKRNAPDGSASVYLLSKETYFGAISLTIQLFHGPRAEATNDFAKTTSIGWSLCTSERLLSAARATEGRALQFRVSLKSNRSAGIVSGYA